MKSARPPHNKTSAVFIDLIDADATDFVLKKKVVLALKPDKVSGRPPNPQAPTAKKQA